MRLAEQPTGIFTGLSVLLPAFNEALTIGQTIDALAARLPGAAFYVCDNNSSDSTAAIARGRGAKVIHETRQGKGFAVTRLFSEAEGEFFLLADADMTYDPAVAPILYEMARQGGFDMVTGVRRHVDQAAYRAGHVVGNRAFSWLFSKLFITSAQDIFSGYRIFSRRFVKSFPVVSSGFEIETELSALASTLRVPVAEVDCAYYPRPEGSSSKLKTYRDGSRILISLLKLYVQYRPLAFFIQIAGLLAVAGLAVGTPSVIDFIETGKVLHFPSAILASGIMVMAFISAVTGLLLDGIKRVAIQQRQLAYLALHGRAA